MMAEEDPFIGGMIVITVIELVRRSDAGVVKRDYFGGKECAIVAVDNRHHQKSAEDKG